jgi:cytochrome c556
MTVEAMPAASVIEERQAVMKSMAAAAKAIGDMFQGRLAYDAKEFKSAAELISARSGQALLDDFPAGSVAETSDANEKIWQQWVEFQIFADRLSVLAGALARDADTSPYTIGSDMRMKPGTMTGGSLLGGRPKPLTEADIAGLPAEHAYHLMLEACTSCHAKFRTRRN